MNAVVERMQRAQQYLQRAAQLEGTGQPKVCRNYVRRAERLIQDARSLVARHRGPQAMDDLVADRWRDFIVALDCVAGIEAAFSKVGRAFADAEAAVAGFAHQAKRLAS